MHFVSSTRWVAGLKRNTGLIKLYRLATVNYEDVSEDVDPRENFELKYIVENKRLIVENNYSTEFVALQTKITLLP